MRRIGIMILSALLATGLALAGLGCQQEEGPAEKAGKAIDQTMEKTGEAAQETMDKAKEETGQAMEKAGEAMQETGQEMQEQKPAEEKQQ